MLITETGVIDRVIDLFGEEITVITRTPEMVDGEIQKNKKGKIIYTENTEIITARIIENNGSEILWNNTIQQKRDATGLFYFTDKDKLNENSRLIYHGQIYYMKKPAERFTGIEVPLNKKEV